MPKMQSAQNEWEQVATTLKFLGSAKQMQHILSSMRLAWSYYSGITDVLTCMTSWRK